MPRAFVVLFVSLIIAGTSWGVVEWVAADVFGDAEATLVAVSVFGDARAPGGVAVSGAGHATGDLLAASGGDASSGFLTVAVLGDAEGAVYGVSLLGDASGSVPVAPLGSCNGTPCFGLAPGGDAGGYYASAASGAAHAGVVSVSLFGPATCAPLEYACAAVSLFGPAQGTVAFSALGPCTGLGCRPLTIFEDNEQYLLAASLFGNASCVWVTGCVAASVFGDAQGWAAVSGAGDATGQNGTSFSVLGDADNSIPLAPLGQCNGTRCIDVQPFGDAEGYWLAVSGTGNATACDRGVLCMGTAVSGLGQAQGAVRASAADGTVCVRDACAAPGEGGACLVVACLGADADGGFACVFSLCTVGRLAGDAEGNFLAASLLGDARGGFALSGAGAAEGCSQGLTCLGASVLGPASGELAVAVVGDATTCSEFSNCAAVSVLGNSAGWQALSVAGDATSTCSFYGCVAATLAGDAQGGLPVSALGQCNGQVCIHAAPAGAEAGLLAVSADGASSDGVAVAAAGPAEGRQLAVAVLGDAAGTFAVSAFGDATSCTAHLDCAAVSGTGDASGGSVAVSLLGRADGPLIHVSACNFVPVACLDPV